MTGYLSSGFSAKVTIMKRRTFSRRTFIKTLGAISLPSIDPRVLKSQWLTGAGDRLKTLRKFGREKGKFGVINQSGDFILPPVYDSWLFFSEGLADVEFGGKYGYIDKTGKVVIEPVYWNAHCFKDGLAPVAKEEGKWGYINLAGEVVVPFQYELAEPFHDGMGRITINGLYGYINVTGQLVIPPLYFVAESFSEGLAYVVRNDRKGIRSGHINKAGEVIIKMKSGHHGRSFHSGLAGVEKNDKWGFIDKTGKWVIKPSYRKIDRFSDGVCSVMV